AEFVSSRAAYKLSHFPKIWGGAKDFCIALLEEAIRLTNLSFKYIFNSIRKVKGKGKPLAVSTSSEIA
ncbi:MAG TPA: hypothetical protein VGD98_08740, partial [Ktedonobacteraceae bacterium]